MRSDFHLAGVVALSLLAAPAFATSTGITGQSGKDGLTCNTCHSGGAAPTVEFSGPATLAPGETGQYSFIIRGGAAKKGGVNIAVSHAAALLQAGVGTKKLGAELSHFEPRDFVGDELRFDFSLVAPSTDVTLTLFGAGNSTNADLGSSGDRSSTARWSVVVGNGSPDAGTGSPDAGTGGDHEEDEPGGGCSTAGGVPVWLLAMTGAFLPLLRRRQG
ncbi:MXAN_6652 family MXYO-CTERM-anchored protein [Vitiosangium sp. GDMCC 1.1324]|uniref:MXAN_6652 family MXYO-CTERM-anchored protein n=1 Tax=Vitiosangium sp. (strain GDMCC 1.1324) TaxID=2138576 RepID=UPI000D37ACEC|nr:MXAN_6652 family MXYO-CTERM-anchored protein [Vitiosangium sp. GDMCC 1.1324]PTL75967.1 hypothetical protein DAT35_51480 [Vitiosangium sp. GDMCC 1.1324]